MSRASYLLLVFPIGILAMGIYIMFMLGSIKDYEAINRASSSSVLYAIENNKIDIAKRILLTDLTQLIYDYDKSVYKKHLNIKLVLCKDIPKYHLVEIKKSLEDTTYLSGKAMKYKRKIFENLNLIKTELCSDCK